MRSRYYGTDKRKETALVSRTIQILWGTDATYSERLEVLHPIQANIKHAIFAHGNISGIKGGYSIAILQPQDFQVPSRNGIDIIEPFLPSLIHGAVETAQPIDKRGLDSTTGPQFEHLEAAILPDQNPELPRGDAGTF